MEGTALRYTLFQSSGRMRKTGGFFCQFLPPIAFVAEDCVVDGLLEELVQQMQQFETPEDFQWLLPHALQFQEIPEIPLNHHDAPAQRAQSDSLLSPAPAEPLINPLDIDFGLGQEANR